MFKKIYTFITKSSADPKATSASIKFFLLASIPYLMQATDIVCQFGHQCYSLDANLLEVIADSFANFIFYTLSMISAGGTLWGLVRKLYRTATGKNEALMYTE